LDSKRGTWARWPTSAASSRPAARAGGPRRLIWSAWSWAGLLSRRTVVSGGGTLRADQRGQRLVRARLLDGATLAHRQHVVQQRKQTLDDDRLGGVGVGVVGGGVGGVGGGGGGGGGVGGGGGGGVGGGVGAVDGGVGGDVGVGGVGAIRIDDHRQRTQFRRGLGQPDSIQRLGSPHAARAVGRQKGPALRQFGPAVGPHDVKQPRPDQPPPRRVVGQHVVDVDTEAADRGAHALGM